MKRSTSVAAVLLLATFSAVAIPAEPACGELPAEPAAVAQGAGRFFCDRTALTGEQRQRQKELGKILRTGLIAVRETDRGFEFEYPGDLAIYRAATEYVPLERACCPFFEFGIRLEPAGGKLRVSLAGPDGVKEFIREEFSWAFER